MAKEVDVYTALTFLDEQIRFSASKLFLDWTDRGDGVAVYENQELGHPELGHRVAVSYGSPAAQIEGDLPTTLPDGLMKDITGGINWRYGLVAYTLRRVPSL